VERHRVGVQAPQAAQRGEPPVLLAAAGDLERLDRVGREPLARRQDRRLALTFLGALQLGRGPSDFLGHPTEPSICSSMSRFSSSAYSMGSSRAMGSTNPRTTIAIASSSVSPRLLAQKSWSSLTLETVASWPIDTSSVRTSTYG